MRSALPFALLLAAGLVGCSDADDLGRALTDGPIEGQFLDDHEHDDECGHEEGDELAEDDVVASASAIVSVTPAPDDGSLDTKASAVDAPSTEDTAAIAPTNGDVVAVAPTKPTTPPPAKPAKQAAEPAKQPEPAATKPAPLTGPFKASNYEWADFDPMIDFDYPELVRVDGDTPPPKLPPDVLAMNGKRIAIEGFMSPLAFDAGGVKEFSLVKDPSFCCFGAIPQMNHWIHVVMPEGQRTEFYSFDPIAVYGTLEVGEQYEDGYVVSLYRMVADKVEGDF